MLGVERLSGGAGNVSRRILAEGPQACARRQLRTLAYAMLSSTSAATSPSLHKRSHCRSGRKRSD